jgi:hypothetical protein
MPDAKRPPNASLDREGSGRLSVSLLAAVVQAAYILELVRR